MQGLLLKISRAQNNEIEQSPVISRFAKQNQRNKSSDKKFTRRGAYEDEQNINEGEEDEDKGARQGASKMCYNSLSQDERRFSLSREGLKNGEI